MKLVAAIVSVFVIMSCSKPSDNQANTEQPDTLQTLRQRLIDTTEVYNQFQEYLDYGAIDTAKLLVIDYDCALLVYPTEEQIEEMKKEYGEDDFYAIADDANFYQGTAIGLLDSLKVKTVTATKPFVRFNGVRSTWTLNLKKKGLPKWNLIFFKTKEEPAIKDAVGLTAQDVNNYFYVDK